MAAHLPRSTEQRTKAHATSTPASIREVLAAAALLAALGAGCAIKLIGDYDETIDRSITAFYESTEAHFARLASRAGTPEARYANNVGFYEEAQARLSVVRLRAVASPGKQLLVKQVDLLRDSVQKLRELHESAGDQALPVEALQAARDGIAVQVESILKLEIALKRGKQMSSAGGERWLS